MSAFFADTDKGFRHVRRRGAKSVLTGRFGSAAYAAEECIAELTASFVLADLGLAHHPRPDHAAYLGSWLQVLKDDPRAIFTAAAKAQAAADWMHRQQPRQTGAHAG